MPAWFVCPRLRDPGEKATHFQGNTEWEAAVLSPFHWRQFFALDEMPGCSTSPLKLPHLETWASAPSAPLRIFTEPNSARTGLTERIAVPVEPYRDRSLTNHHVYHQYCHPHIHAAMLYTRTHLGKTPKSRPAIYYPLGLHEQECFAYLGYEKR